MFNFQFLIGSIVGFFIALVLFVSLLLTDLNLNLNLDVGVATNIFIALATQLQLLFITAQFKNKEKIVFGK